MRAVSSLLIVWVGTFAASGAAAHEFWIAPDPYRLEPGSEFSAQLRVGQDMSGAAYPYLSATIAEMRHWTEEGSQPIDAREGDLPAIAGIDLEVPGLHRFSVATDPAYIVFDDITDFADYLAYEGLTPVVTMHRERGLAETEIAEAYIRNARSLIQVGPARADQKDAPTGMPYEITALTNPYLPDVSELDVLLQWQGNAESGTQISVFYLSPGGNVPDATVRSLTLTDKHGHARVKIDQPGTYLLNAVHMEEADGPGSVVWQSHWASLTFFVGSEE